MFGKLLKHNFLDTWKEFCSLYGVIIVLGVLLGAAASTGYGALFTIISILFGGSFVAIVVLYIIYFGIRKTRLSHSFDSRFGS